MTHTFKCYKHTDGRMWLLYNGRVVISMIRPFDPTAVIMPVLKMYGKVGSKRLRKIDVTTIKIPVIVVTHPQFSRPLDEVTA